MSKKKKKKKKMLRQQKIPTVCVFNSWYVANGSSEPNNKICNFINKEARRSFPVNFLKF